MYIDSLTLNNYRNYKKESINFSSGINVLVGKNAQGKTNAAEAIYYLCTGYSPRVNNDKQVIMYGEKEGYIKGQAVTRYGNVNVEINFNQKGKKISVNSVPIKKIGELMGNINSVFFNPGDLKLIKESPEDRRRFMNIAICQVNKSYFYNLQLFNKVLEERNTLLKKEDKELINNTISLWDDKLVEYGSLIIEERRKFINEIRENVIKSHDYISSGNEKISINLETLEGEDIKDVYIKKLREKRDVDIILGYTSSGPQRDDIKIKLDDRDVRLFGSQGQQRTCALSLKLAEMEMFYEKTGEYPILILDDAMSELDMDRRTKLVERISKGQVIITCTDYVKISNDEKIIYVNQGGISYEN